MNTYPANTNVTVAIPFVDLNGAPVSPVGMTLSYQVLDELENIVQGPVTLANPAATDQAAVIVVLAVNNGLAGPRPNLNEGVAEGNPIITTLGLREIQLTMTTANGSYVAKAQYIVGSPDARLVLLQNSFQTYNLALLTASQIPNLMSWGLASEGDRINAMTAAWLGLTKLGYFVRWPRDPDAQNYLNWFDSANEIIIPRLWSVMTTDRWYNYYPELFRAAMRRAQVVEADAILTQSPLNVKRQAGVIMEKIGQSEIQFRNSMPLDIGISKATLKCIEGYIDFRYTLSRS